MDFETALATIGNALILLDEFTPAQQGRILQTLAGRIRPNCFVLCSKPDPCWATGKALACSGSLVSDFLPGQELHSFFVALRPFSRLIGIPYLR
jgi:hypothetical protein